MISTLLSRSSQINIHVHLHVHTSGASKLSQLQIRVTHGIAQIKAPKQRQLAKENSAPTRMRIVLGRAHHVLVRAAWADWFAQDIYAQDIVNNSRLTDRALVFPWYLIFGEWSRLFEKIGGACHSWWGPQGGGDIGPNVIQAVKR